MRYLLSAAAIALLAGCDAVAPAPEADVALSLAEVRSADVLYDLAPLDVGERFAITTDGPAGPVALRSDRTADGYALSLDLGELRPARVEVRYLANGQEVAPSQTLSLDAPLLAGTSEDGPDSWHYEWRDGAWILIKDYRKKDDDATASMRTSGSTSFTTLAGETVSVTDVEFRLIGVDAPAPTSVRFESPSAFRFAQRQVDGHPVEIGALR